MKKKNAMALFLAGTMLMSQTVVFADAKVSTTSDSVIENDNSTAPNIKDVVLPTITGNTYDFTIDRNDLLPQYDVVADKYDGSNVYFESLSKRASMITKATVGSETVEVTALEKAKTKADLSVLVNNIASVTDADKDGVAEAVTFKASPTDVYVYGPGATVNNKSTNTGAGEYVPITVSNIKDYFDVFTVEGDGGSMELSEVVFRSDINTLVKGGVCTGVLYEDGYRAIDPIALANEDANAGTVYFSDVKTHTLASGVKLYYMDDSGDPVQYKELSDGNFTYVPATKVFANVSQGAEVVNKSTNPIAVDVNVTFSNVEGLDFLASDETTDTKKTDVSDRNNSVEYTNPDEERDGIADVRGVWFSLTARDDNVSFADNNATDITLDKVKVDPAATVKAASGKATMILEAAPYTPVTYQGRTIVKSTGSHNYYQYFNADEVEFNRASFYLTGAVDTDPSGDDLWEEYVEGIESGAYQKPTVSVVYSFAEAERKVETITDPYGDEVEQLSYVVTALAGRNKIKEAEATVDVAQADAEKLQGQYNVAYKAYLDAKAADEAQEKKLKEAEAALDKAIADLKAEVRTIAIDAYNDQVKNADKGNTTTSYTDADEAYDTILADVINMSAGKGLYVDGDKLIGGVTITTDWKTAQDAYIDEYEARIKPNGGSGFATVDLAADVDSQKNNVVTHATPAFSGTYAVLHDAIVLLETERISLAEAEAALTTAKSNLATAKSTATVLKTYCNTDYKKSGSNYVKDGDDYVLDTTNDYWE